MFNRLGDVILGSAAHKNKRAEAIHRANAKNLTKEATITSSKSATSATLAQNSFANLQAAGPNTGPLARKAREVNKEAAFRHAKDAHEHAERANRLRDASSKADLAADTAKSRPGNLLDVVASFVGVTK